MGKEIVKAENLKIVPDIPQFFGSGRPSKIADKRSRS
jgi:hypothetical protein